MSIPCPGYPDPLEQGYRDQSNLVMKKAEASYQKKKNLLATKAKLSSTSPSSVATPPESTHLQVDGSSSVSGLLGRKPCLHIDTIAVTDFMDSYVPQSPFDYLLTIYKHPRLETSLEVNVRAVSLAMTASKLKDLYVLQSARQLYATALSNTNAALRNPDTAIQDSTLVSVLLLGLFEALSCQLTGISSDWAAHTRGALALLRLRGKQQFDSELGRRLFEQMCSILTFDTVLRRTQVPGELLELVSLAKMLRWESPKMAFVNLLGEITHSPCALWDSAMPPLEKIEKFQLFDSKVQRFTTQLPPDFEFREVHQEVPNTQSSGWDTHGHAIHLYHHHHAARLWNACRVLRIMLNGALHRTLSGLPCSISSAHGQWKSAIQCASENIRNAATDICASVPQFLNPEKYDTYGIEASDEARVATLLAALSVTKAETLAPQTARSYAGDRLRYLGKKFKVPQAENAALGKGLGVLHSGFHMLYVY